MARGFNALKGRVITTVNSKCVNEIAIYTGDDHYFVIEANVSKEGIPILTCKKYKDHRIKLSKPEGK